MTKVLGINECLVAVGGIKSFDDVPGSDGALIR